MRVKRLPFFFITDPSRLVNLARKIEVKDCPFSRAFKAVVAVEFFDNTSDNRKTESMALRLDVFEVCKGLKELFMFFGRDSRSVVTDLEADHSIGEFR